MYYVVNGCMRQKRPRTSVESDGYRNEHEVEVSRANKRLRIENLRCVDYNKSGILGIAAGTHHQHDIVGSTSN
mgnify:CR=1 FL=1